VPAWQDLGAHAIEPNPFYEPFMLLPALDAFGKAAALQFVFIYAARGARPALIGFLPMDAPASTKACRSPTFVCGCIAIAIYARRSSAAARRSAA
jgi:hypothetical protein